VTGREGPGPERPGPDYPPEWDAEPSGRCTCLPYPYGDGPEEDCPEHGRSDAGELDDLVVRIEVVVPDPWASQGPVPPPPF
jgi:hypothetical protein